MSIFFFFFLFALVFTEIVLHLVGVARKCHNKCELLDFWSIRGGESKTFGEIS